MAAVSGGGTGGGGDSSAAELQQMVRTLPQTGDNSLRAVRALKALVQGRMALEGGLDKASRIEDRVRALIDTLRPTAFGQAHEPRLLARLLRGAEYTCLSPETRVELRGQSDALYVLLSGSLEMLRGPATKRTLWITVESGHDLPGDSERDRLDPYCVVNVGGKTFTSPVMDDAGANPVWNWTFSVVHTADQRVEITVMEHDDYSRDDLIGVAIIEPHTFDREGFHGLVGLSAVMSHEPAKEPAGGGKGNRGSMSCHMGAAAGGGQQGALKVKLAWGPETSLGNSQPDASHLMRASTEATLKFSSTMPLPAHGGSGSPQASPQSSLSPGRPNNGAASGAANAPGTQRSRSSSAIQSPPPERASERTGVVAAPSAEPGVRTLAAGQFLGMTPGGGALRTLEQCQLLFVPRHLVSKAMSEYRTECSTEKNDFLRKHFPGAQDLDPRTFEVFFSAFQPAVLPPRRAVCKAGDLVAADSRKVYILRSGTCSVTLPNPTSSVTASPLGRYDQVLRAPDRAENSLGLLGVGSVLGYASALFNLPEPFTAIANEPLSVFAISMTERPFSQWPKDVVAKLQDSLRARTDFHLGRRAKLTEHPAILPIPDTSGLSPQEIYQRRMPEWKASESRFWRHKEMPGWRAETIRDLYDAVGWAPSVSPARPSMSSSSCGTLSLPGGHATAPAATPTPLSADTSRRPSKLSTPPAASDAEPRAVAGASVPPRSSPAAAAAGAVAMGATTTSMGATATSAAVATATAGLVVHVQRPATGQQWSSAGRISAGAGGLLESRSEPALPTRGPGSSPPPTAPGSAVVGGASGTRPGSGASLAAHQRGTYNVNSGLGRCSTPWGTWSPSGMLPVPKRAGSIRAEKYLRNATEKRKQQRRRTDPNDGDDDEGQPSDRERLEPPPVNLRCERDWKRFSTAANSSALEKMYKRQVRARALKCTGAAGAVLA